MLNSQWQLRRFTFMLHGIRMGRQFTVYILNTCVVPSQLPAYCICHVQLDNIRYRLQGLKCFTTCWWLTSLYVSFMPWSISQRPGVPNSAEYCFFTWLCLCWPGGVICFLHNVSVHRNPNVSVSEFRTGRHCPHCLISQLQQGQRLKMCHDYVIPHAPQSTIHEYQVEWQNPWIWFVPKEVWIGS